MKKNNKRIYLSPPDQTGLEEANLKEVLSSNWIAPVGPQIEFFEIEIAKKTGYKYALALNSATSALHLSLLAHDIGKGDKVLCSSLTFCASANAIIYTNAEPVFIDSEATSWNMNLDVLEAYLSTTDDRPKALIITHIYGMPIDMVRMDNLSRTYGFVLVHNMAEAFGAKFMNKSAGNYSGSGVVSFNGNKLITTGGGGAFLTNDLAQYEKALYLANQAKSEQKYYLHETVGYNYRLSNVLAALGLAQIAYLESKIIRKRKVYETYKKAFEFIPGITFQEEIEGAESDRWLSCILIDDKVFDISTSEIVTCFESENIEVRRTWNPMHLQPAYSKYQYIGGKVSEEIFEKGICLPSGCGMTDQEQARVIEILLNTLKLKSNMHLASQ